jgi:hypothetical protein
MILVKFLSGRAHLILLLSLVVMGAAALLTVEWRALFGFFDILTREIQVAQRHFHAELGAAIHAVKANERLALFNLTFIGFLYGVFHAAGPGHGKFVISTYLAIRGGRCGADGWPSRSWFPRRASECDLDRDSKLRIDRPDRIGRYYICA